MFGGGGQAPALPDEAAPAVPEAPAPAAPITPASSAGAGPASTAVVPPLQTIRNCGSQVKPSPQSTAFSHGRRYRGTQMWSTVSVHAGGGEPASAHDEPGAHGAMNAPAQVPVVRS